MLRLTATFLNPQKVRIRKSKYYVDLFNIPQDQGKEILAKSSPSKGHVKELYNSALNIMLCFKHNFCHHTRNIHAASEHRKYFHTYTSLTLRLFALTRVDIWNIWPNRRNMDEVVYLGFYSSCEKA